MDPKTVEKLEEKLKEAIAEVANVDGQRPPTKCETT
jgi:hypothetical protein